MEVKEFKNGNETIKIGNTEFRVDNFKPKTKQEFVDKYKPLKVKKGDKEEIVNPWNFNRDEAWDFLKQFVKSDPKK